MHAERLGMAERLGIAGLGALVYQTLTLRDSTNGNFAVNTDKFYCSRLLKDRRRVAEHVEGTRDPQGDLLFLVHAGRPHFVPPVPLK